MTECLQIFFFLEAPFYEAAFIYYFLLILYNFGFGSLTSSGKIVPESRISVGKLLQMALKDLLLKISRQTKLWGVHTVVLIFLLVDMNITFFEQRVDICV